MSFARFWQDAHWSYTRPVYLPETTNLPCCSASSEAEYEDWEFRPAPCVRGARPSETRQQGPSFFAFDHRLDHAEEFGLSVSQRGVGEAVRNRWLQRALDAFDGRADPVLLKLAYPTRHGDLIETFLDIRRGRADLTNWKELGFQEFLWIRCPASQMVLVEPVNSMLLVPIRPRRAAERARLLLRLDAEESEELGVFPH